MEISRGDDEDGGHRQVSCMSREYLREGRECSDADQYDDGKRSVWPHQSQ